MITVELDKEDLIHILRGIYPSFILMNELEDKDIGHYSDNRGWSWNMDLLKDMTEDQLLALYNKCKTVK